MATMLVFILTDFEISRADLRSMLPRAVDGSFNAMSIDSDESTSDTVALVSSNRSPLPPSRLGEFEAALKDVCNELAGDVVRNGEGVQVCVGRCV
jgi:glutamate N-acetyltransferase / amino-acid N-acetyltransferase